MSTIAPDQLFVIACPVCRGHIAATGGMCGHDACCPLCASLFHVPALTLAGPVVPPSPPPPAPAEDWGIVIETLAPPVAQVPESRDLEHRSDFEILAATAADPVDVAAPSTVGELSFVADPPASTVSTVSVEPVGTLHEASPPLPSADWIDEVLATPGPDDDGAQAEAPDGLPYLGPSLLEPAEQELEFREPVRTVRHGDKVVEIRRLTPEERQARRFRRNLMMIVIGVSILMAIVVIFGVPTKPTR
jgi:hypothetical protein